MKYTIEDSISVQKKIRNLEDRIDRMDDERAAELVDQLYALRQMLEEIHAELYK